MKIYINRKPVQGPWGGGNKTVIRLCAFLQSGAHEVVHSLKHNDIDIIFCFDPRLNSNKEWYQDFLNYKLRTGCKIIQRVGDLGTHGKPDLTNLVKQTMKYSDFFIFPSHWAKDWIGYSGNNYQIINNAPLPIYHKFKTKKDINSTIKLITHHWSTNVKKGFDFYAELDKYVGSNSNLEFTYIGRLPDNFKFKNCKYVQATGNNELLAKRLSESDIYITASKQEAGANHVLEAMAAGLPVLFHEDGGSIINYCNQYGLSFRNLDSFLISLEEIRLSYLNYKEKVMEFDSNIDSVIARYGEIICKMQE